jgi:TonB-linked SusC/RagA family outer membrane protein
MKLTAWENFPYPVRKAWRLMRITTLLILVISLHLSAKTTAQKITLTAKNITVEQFFNQLEKQTGFSFISENGVVSKDEKISVNVKDATLETVLDQILTPINLSYKIEDKTVHILKVSPTPDLSRGVISPSPDSLSSLPPPVDVHGHITDSLGAPLVGASITVKGSRKGTETDAKGNFVLYGVNDNATLIISFTGFEKKQFKVNGSNSISVALNKSNDILDQVQIIAYGTTTRRLSVGNITTVSAETIEKQPVTNVLLALQNQAPGLFITQTNGLNGGGVTVRIQGQNSITNGNDPFYVIDGVPYASFILQTGLDGVLGGAGAAGAGPNNGYGSPFNYINPGDIESVEILKDADATAIYGSRAANGAILITTKKGKAGAARFNLNLQQGYSADPHFVDMLNTRQYLDMRYQAFRNDGINWTDPNVSANDLKVWDTTRYTNWQKALIGGTAQYTNITGSLSGGSSFVQYLVSGTYNRQTTVFPGSFADQKGSLHFSLTSASANQKFHFQFSGEYMIDDNKLPNTDLTGPATLLEPDAPAVYNKDGTLNWEPNVNGNSTWYNPLASYTLRTFERKTNNLISNAVLSYNIIPGLDIKSSFGFTDMTLSDYTPMPLTEYRPEDRMYYTISSSFANSTANSWIIEPQLTYKKNIGKGKLDLLFGGTIQQNQSNANAFLGTGYSSEQLMQDIAAATTITSYGSSFSQYKYAALYGRANYVWEDKYILDLTGRRDGSSRFGSSEQFHDFWSIGAGWIFNEEELFKNSKIFSFGKLHGSYGTTGNDQIGDYQFLSLYYPTYAPGLPYQNSSGLAPANLANPNLEWEETRKLQGGIDLGFLNNRILLNAVYAYNRSSNQLLSIPLPQIAGFVNVAANLPATVQNTDWEFTLNTVNIKGKDFNWTSRLNVTVPENKLIAFPGLATSSVSFFYAIGQPLNIIKVNHFIGVDPATGQYEFTDKKGTPTFNPTYPDDYDKVVSLAPKFYGGLQNTLSYKGVQLDFTFSFTKQMGRNYSYYNGSGIIPGAFYEGSSNQPTSVLNNWQKPGDIAPIAAYSTAGYSPSLYNVEASDYGYTDASYIRLQNVSLSWQLPKKWMASSHLQNTRIYFQGQNLLVFTHDQVVADPQTGLGALPPLRTLTIGLQTGL